MTINAVTFVDRTPHLLCTAVQVNNMFDNAESQTQAFNHLPTLAPVQIAEIVFLDIPVSSQYSFISGALKYLVFAGFAD
jgi:hypothetical protein